MDIGVAVPLPADVLGSGTTGLRAYVQTVEGLGFDHLAVHDHVLGIDPSAIPEQDVRYTHRSSFHEPLTTLAWVAAVAPRLRLMTTVLVSPQRQLALWAKQASQVALLSDDRLTVGVGIGVNSYEYEALGVEFRHRGRILDEQLALLRPLWSGAPQTAEGEGFRMRGAAIAPVPSAPIRLLVGGNSDAAIARAARFADGLMLMTSDDELGSSISKMRDALREAGRDPAGFAFHGFAEVATGSATDWRDRIDRAEAAGLTSLSLMTGHPRVDARSELSTLDHHLDRLRAVADELAGSTK